VVLELTALARPLAAAQRYQQAFQQPFPIAGRMLSLTASVGVTTTRDSAANADLLLRDADAAMSSSKASGRGQIRAFRPEMADALRFRFEIESELRAGLLRGELKPLYQPIVDIQTGVIKGVEALTRWEHPSRGPILPGVFVPVAEESGLIVDLGLAVLRTACHDAAHRFPPTMQLSVNVSSTELQNPSYPASVRNALAMTGLHPARLCLEITESVVIHDDGRAQAALKELAQTGVSIALDDFGTGYCSLSYLTRLPIRGLKIDRQFVAPLAEAGQANGIVRAVLALGRELDLGVVAEGVEDVATLTALRDLGCPSGQGYLFGRPMAADDVEQLSNCSYTELWRRNATQRLQGLL
jgi:predicted signal transduction protein with EAL and GGDEF domain